MPTFAKSVLIDAPVATVFAFHEREDAISILSPAFPAVRMIGMTDGIRPGSQVELRVGPFSWIALHTAYENERLFADEQIKGPFAKWVHRHEFEDVDGKTRLTDRVEFQLPGGALINVLFGWIAKAGLRRTFSHRHRVTRQVCEKS